MKATIYAEKETINVKLGAKIKRFSGLTQAYSYCRSIRVDFLVTI